MQSKVNIAAKDVARIISDKIKSLVPISSGKLRDSITANVNESGDLVDILIDGESYFKYIDKGRLPGTFPPLDAIQAWATARKIETKAVFSIARSIYNKGIKPLNISDKLIADTDNNVKDKLGLALADDMESKLADILNELVK